MRLTTPVIIAFAAACLANADTITLRGGDVVRGTYLGGNARQVRVDVDGNVRTFDVGQVRSISFIDDGNQNQAPPPQAQLYPAQTYPAQNTQQQTANNVSNNGGMFIPGDTPITIRMIDGVNSETAHMGQTFRASIDEPVTVNGQQVIPRGADVLTKLIADQQSGKLQGRTILTLALVNITIDGRAMDVSSTSVETASASRGAKTGKVVGGATALGAILGGIAGGGKGAAIGAVSGAAVGGGAQVLTSGQKVNIPSETRLTFRLQAPIQL